MDRSELTLLNRQITDISVRLEPLQKELEQVTAQHELLKDLRQGLQQEFKDLLKKDLVSMNSYRAVKDQYEAAIDNTEAYGLKRLKTEGLVNHLKAEQIRLQMLYEDSVKKFEARGADVLEFKK